MLVIMALFGGGLLLARALDWSPGSPGATGSVLLTASRVANGPGSGPFYEVKTARETPEIRCTDETGDGSSRVTFDGPEGHYALDCPANGTASVTLPAGEYGYALLGSRYQLLGEPDQRGRLRCRRFRRYDLSITRATIDSSRYQDIGDAF